VLGNLHPHFSFQVTSVYSTALEKLSIVEPSIDHLRILADFLQSGFVRIQADAMLAFQKFWRATYHQRKDIFRKNYPVAIKTCLKAWGDVCDDSLADDISLGPESQSLVSFFIYFCFKRPSQSNVGKLYDSGFSAFCKWS